MDLRQKISELTIKAEVLNSNMMMARDVIVEGENPVENYEWSLSDLHDKTFDLRNELKRLEEYLYQLAKEELETRQA